MLGPLKAELATLGRSKKDLIKEVATQAAQIEASGEQLTSVSATLASVTTETDTLRVEGAAALGRAVDAETELGPLREEIIGLREMAKQSKSSKSESQLLTRAWLLTIYAVDASPYRLTHAVYHDPYSWPCFSHACMLTGAWTPMVAPVPVCRHREHSRHRHRSAGPASGSTAGERQAPQGGGSGTSPGRVEGWHR